MNILGNGVYNITEAAILADLKPSRVRAWFRPIKEGRPSRGFFESDYPSVDGDRAISFLDLIEVYIVGRLREAAEPVPLQSIRRVHDKLRRQTGERHPFCTRDIYTSCGRIFTHAVTGNGGKQLVEALTDQAYFEEVIMPFLEKIEYDNLTHRAALWHIAEGVVVDPGRCFGKPVVDDVSITTHVLAAAYKANGRDSRRVADWYGIEPHHVQVAVQFEDRLAA